MSRALDKQVNSGCSRKEVNTRLCWVLAFALIIIVALGVGRVAQLQSQRGQEYEAKAIGNQVNQIMDKVINPNRGSILDRNNQILAVSTNVYNIVLDVRVMVNQEDKVIQQTLQDLSGILEIPMEELSKYGQYVPNPEGGVGKTKKPADEAYDTHYLVLKQKVDYSVGKQIEELGYNWVIAESDTKRAYPHNTLAAHVIGFVHGANSLGIESQYNDYMVGTPGRIFRTYESNGAVVTRKENATAGNNVITTLDLTIQGFAENAAKKAYDDYAPENCSIVVMNPSTGEVFAMANYPTFDLNNPEDLYVNDRKTVETHKIVEISAENIELERANLQEGEEIIEESRINSEGEEVITYKKKIPKSEAEIKSEKSNMVWNNFCITDTFEPGSIYKPIVTAMAMDEAKLSGNDTFFCPGVKTVADYDIRCHQAGGHGVIDVSGVLAGSCNVGMMEIITKLDRQTYYNCQRNFGFGEKTGIDLPKEISASGLLYSVENLNTAEMATSSFGQGFNCTAIQAISSLAATINGGNLMRPYVVSQVVDENNNVVFENSPKILRKVVSEETSDYTRKTLQSVVTTEGTGKKGIIEGYAIGGKTGTAEQGSRDDNVYTLSYIAYLPVENPEIIAMCVIHKPEGDYESRGISPVPVLTEVLENIISYKAIPPSAESEEVELNANQKAKNYVGMSLREVVSELNMQGRDFELVGSGSVVSSQLPVAGDSIKNEDSFLFTVSAEDGVELVAVPNIVGLSEEDAKKMLDAAGLAYYIEKEAVEEVVEAEGSENEEAAGEEATAIQKVYSQTPPEGVKVEGGFQVKVKLR